MKEETYGWGFPFPPTDEEEEILGMSIKRMSKTLPILLKRGYPSDRYYALVDVLNFRISIWNAQHE